ncbi:uncharacterized protein BX664DRAFT_328823 [Halteromyces radiatus]|uniref:uncharacterized protein n=1 Tax=Halteromyces radiatus TaxID=101107 RepID=UPI002220FD7E|nr:uncharacterized protein BX664DRAFT_328823 [Halteromyces radiatus]KAI8093059.1 hypothetical protein BX664DRAFT_328823 [Halteromyces radiatus]
MTTSTTQIQNDTPLVSSSISSQHLLAIERYIAGIKLEQQGSVSEALTCFQQAFKLNPDVDVAYSYKERKLSSSSIFSTAEDVENHQDHVTSIVSSTFASIEDFIEHICQEGELTYNPLKKTKPIWIIKLPGEIIVHILCHLILQSLGSIAQFGLVCKPFFLLSRSPTLWRFASEHLFKQSYMSFEQSRQTQLSLVDQYQGNWMRMLKERPRIRYDGVYISTCQYVRPGVSETAWTRPVHLVTYYRYLRFFPDGRVMNFISNDAPVQVVKLLVPSFSKRQLFRGRFEWDGERKVIIHMKEDGRPNEQFIMNLNIKHPYQEKRRKRGVYKLTWESYVSHKVDDDSFINPYNLKLMKPFIFSAVTSYHVDFSINEK